MDTLLSNLAFHTKAKNKTNRWDAVNPSCWYPTFIYICFDIHFTGMVITERKIDDWLGLNVPVNCIKVIYRHYLSPVMRKPVFGVSGQVRLKPACSATETS